MSFPAWVPLGSAVARRRLEQFGRVAGGILDQDLMIMVHSHNEHTSAFDMEVDSRASIRLPGQFERPIPTAAQTGLL